MVNGSVTDSASRRFSLLDALGAAAQKGIDLMVRALGRRVMKADAPWLNSPIGPRGRIGEGLYELVAKQEGLELRRGIAGAGLVPDFDELKGPGFDPAAVHPAIRHFYEHTSLYTLEAWSMASWLTKPFLWALVTLVSRRMDQLNFPVSPLDVSRGMSSDILQLVDAKTGRVAYTGWLRKLTGTGRIIYVGFYTHGRPPRCSSPCVKVSFPVPNGSATVFLRPRTNADGSFDLISAGDGFGDAGFYRMVETGPDHWTVRYWRTLHEHFHVWVDEAGDLRTDHTVRFCGLTILRLHYKLVRRG